MAKMKVTRYKNTFCHTCQKGFHYLGIARHRKAHKKRFEDCEITFTYGNRELYEYSLLKLRKDGE